MRAKAGKQHDRLGPERGRDRLTGAEARRESREFTEQEPQARSGNAFRARLSGKSQPLHRTGVRPERAVAGHGKTGHPAKLGIAYQQAMNGHQLFFAFSSSPLQSPVRREVMVIDWVMALPSGIDTVEWVCTS